MISGILLKDGSLTYPKYIGDVTSPVAAGRPTVNGSGYDVEAP
jgi:hypothetical protein